MLEHQEGFASDWLYIGADRALVPPVQLSCLKQAETGTCIARLKTLSLVWANTRNYMIARGAR